MSAVSRKNQLTIPAGVMREGGPSPDDDVRVRASRAPGIRRQLCAVNHAEMLIGPVRPAARERVEQMLRRFSIETIQVGMALAERTAAVRARTDLRLPDAFALATAIRAEHRGHQDVELAGFDDAVLNAHASLHPQQP